MSTYFGWQRVIWFDQLLMQYEIFWRGMHNELMHCELVYCIFKDALTFACLSGKDLVGDWRLLSDPEVSRSSWRSVRTSIF